MLIMTKNKAVLIECLSKRKYVMHIQYIQKD